MPSIAFRSARGALRSASVTALLILSALGSSHAATFKDPVTVSLIAPGGYTSDGVSITPDPLNLQQSLLPPSGSITAANAGAISDFMLPIESISLSNTNILVRIGEGASNGTTGYLGLGAQHARYQFDGLSIAGQLITGLTYTLTDTSGAGAGSFIGVDNAPALVAANFIHLNSPSSLSVDLDQIHFKDRGLGESQNFADFTISLVTSPVPEPASAALALLGVMTAVGLRARRRHDTA